MRTWWTTAAFVGLAALGVAECGSSSAKAKVSATANECTSGPGLTQTATTSKYTMVLDVNPSEMMYTQAQVTATHPTTGEVMLRGQMNDMPTTVAGGSLSSTMPMSSSTMPMSSTTMMGAGGSKVTPTVRHLEVHICSVSNGKVVPDAQPTITVVDHASGGMTDQVPIAVMQGIGSGVADLHYGNNITMPAGHPYTVTVHLDGDTATFNFTGPM